MEVSEEKKEAGNNGVTPLPGQQTLNCSGQPPFKPLAHITHHCELSLSERGDDNPESL